MSDIDLKDKIKCVKCGLEFVPVKYRQLQAENDIYEEIYNEIMNWCKAYPIDVFPEPDFKKAHEILKEHGMGIDSISASNMRHVLNGIQDILKALGDKK